MKVYLAGFDVFRPDVDAVFQDLREQASRLGLVAVAPLDGEPGPAGQSPAEQAHRIYRDNISMLSSADAVIANLAPFRGHEPDSGTVFEVGFAIARGIPVVGYGVPPGSYSERFRAGHACVQDEAGAWREPGTGMLVEDFGLPLNLMLACSIELRATASEALQALARRAAAKVAILRAHD
ncbi:nucleoside 2-deoxyribosyltransferase [Xylophilus rhododendri]|uniref:Nucleoside 2-deoxyribosyltransferase n=1 Tax=Xylophilus rhododendri TaxID=2697032 RepID=A0A857J9B0_9BURK|nr:nucleoside 2-deoxyribosyltransferase [Xylophilus rhododendri]QHI99639.1 nucleoside 2-deoxyribosyltransferase [Xylophilus rhododendri]